MDLEKVPAALEDFQKLLKEHNRRKGCHGETHLQPAVILYGLDQINETLKEILSATTSKNT